MIEFNRKKEFILLIIILIILLVIFCKFGKKNTVVGKDNIIEFNEFNGKHLYDESINDFEIIEKFLSDNQQVFMVLPRDNQLKANWKKYDVNGYYLYYDYYFEDIDYYFDNNTNDFINSLKKIGVNQIIGSYVSLTGESKNRIYSYYIFLEYNASGKKYGYKLCIDESCQIEDEYTEEEKYHQKKYREVKKINNSWASYYSNIPS